MAIPLGKHTAHIDGDILILEIVGNLSVEEMDSYLGLAEQLRVKHGHFFIIDDLTHLGSAEPAVRRKVAGWLPQSGCLGAALYGASLVSRTLALLVVGAMNMLGHYTVPVAFFKTAQDARDWVAAQRLKYTA